MDLISAGSRSLSFEKKVNAFGTTINTTIIFAEFFFFDKSTTCSDFKLNAKVYFFQGNPFIFFSVVVA